MTLKVGMLYTVVYGKPIGVFFKYYGQCISVGYYASRLVCIVPCV